MKRIFISLINMYQKHISPLFPRKCRFYPSCSEYAKQAIDKYGVVKGIFLRRKENSKM